MSLEKIVAGAMSGRPLEMKEAFAEEIQQRIINRLEEKYMEMTEPLDEAFKVGDAVLTKIGGKWLPATISKPMNASGNYGVKANYNKKVINTVSSEAQLKSANESLEEAAKVTHKWYSVKDWKNDGDFDELDDLHGEREARKFGPIKSGEDSPRSTHKHYHLGIPVANTAAIKYMDSNAKAVV
jgi:hypothetical protein